MRRRAKRSTVPVRVREVETLACPAGGLHRLACDRYAHVACLGCGESWAVLDAGVRAS